MKRKAGRNDPCPCGSGRKYKQCCLNPGQEKTEETRSGVPEAHILLQEAVGHHQSGRLIQAEALYRQLLQSDPEHPEALHLLGLIAHQVGKKDLALELIGQAIDLRPDVAHFRFNRGVTRQELGRLDEAVDDYRNAVRLKPDYYEAWENLGVALRDIGDYGPAIEATQEALRIRADSALAHNNLALLFKQNGHFGDAMEQHREAIRCDPAFAEAHKNLGLSLIRAKQFDEGWKEYEWRFYSPEYRETNPVRVTPFPKWDGSPLKGKSILVRPEQGVGDEIMFASCFQDLVNEASLCIIECDPRLVELFSRSFPSAVFIPARGGEDLSWVTELPPIDFWIPAGSLPRFCRKSLNAFPQRTGYLRADETQQNIWKEKLKSLDGNVNLGISWRGGKGARAQLDRSVPLGQWEGLFHLPGVRIINLQYGDHRQEIVEFTERCGANLVSFDELDTLRELDRFAGLISALDMVISIDNSTLHMAGALGTPVWALLPFPADWRWFLPEDRVSHWYPSMRLFRRPGMKTESWDIVMTSVFEALRKVFAGEETAVDSVAR